MDLNAHRADHQRKRRRRSVPLHVYGHHGVQAAHRGRLNQGCE